MLNPGADVPTRGVPAPPTVRTLNDLQDEGHERLLVVCPVCGMTGSYSVARLAGAYGPAPLPKVLAMLARNCRQGLSLKDHTCKAQIRQDIE